MPQRGSNCTTSNSISHKQQESNAEEMERQGEPRPRQGTQKTWAKVVGAVAKSASARTTVVHKKKTKKHPLEQRRNLFVSNNMGPERDPKDVMFEVNKALAHKKADVTVRLISLRYTKKGHLSGLMHENANADLLRYGAVAFAAACKADPAIIDIEKAGKWRKLRVHGVALDRYLAGVRAALDQERHAHRAIRQRSDQAITTGGHSEKQTRRRHHAGQGTVVRRQTP